MMDVKKVVVIITLLVFALCVSILLYNSYFGIRLRQEGLEKTFNKNLLKNAGFSSVGKRVFEFCFDFLLFWVVFVYKDGNIITKVGSVLDVILGKIIFILPVSRTALMNMDFLLYSFGVVSAIAGITAFLCAISISLKILGGCIAGLLLFPIIWYIDLGICYFFLKCLRVGTTGTALNYILSVICYILIFAINAFIVYIISPD